MKTVATVAFCALIGFGASTFVAKNRAPSLNSAGADARQPAAISALTEDNQRLDNELQGLKAAVDDLKNANAKVVTERANRQPAFGEVGRIIGLPLQQYEIRDGVMQNFRQLAGAQDQYKLEHGRWPSSIHDLVGRKNYIHGIVPVDGENYADLSWGGRTFRLTTKSGHTIAYANDEPVDSNLPEFRVDYPPEVSRARELEKKLEGPKKAATEAYRLANRGKNPPDEKALIAFFTDVNDGADFVEYLEAKKTLPQ